MSPEGRAFIRAEEGTRLHIYADQVGILTVGIGHRLSETEKRTGVFAEGLTTFQADVLLAKDLAWVEAAIAKHITALLTQYEFDALCSLVFNVGPRTLTLDVGPALNRGDVEEALRQWATWRKGGDPPRVLPVLVRRRAREIALFRGDAAPT